MAAWSPWERAAKKGGGMMVAAQGQPAGWEEERFWYAPGGAREELFIRKRQPIAA